MHLLNYLWEQDFFKLKITKLKKKTILAEQFDCNAILDMLEFKPAPAGWLSAFK